VSASGVGQSRTECVSEEQHLSDLSYALVTPARNETRNLRRLANCLRQQTHSPTAWVIVDDGSTDDTLLAAASLAEEHDWVTVLSSPGAITHEGPLDRGRGVGRDVIAFKAGLANLSVPVDIVLKLDADVSVEPDFFERMLAAFAVDESLGIASGTCYEFEGGEWHPQHVTAGHVRGATRAYRWSCLEDVSPLEERLGWDGIDWLKARSLGWTTKSLADLPFRHHRPMGKRDGLLRAWVGRGEAAYFIGYRFSYMTIRALYHSRRDPRAIAMLLGYVAAWACRRPRCGDPGVRTVLRELQSLRRLGSRFREAKGRA
jgi:glycosyltransferase involved in cell wall biosynthesis